MPRAAVAFIEGVLVDDQFLLSGRSMRFVPLRIMERLCAARLRRRLRRRSYGPFPTPFLDGLEKTRWVVISATRFPGPDLAFEYSAARVMGRWAPAAWINRGAACSGWRH